MGQQLGQVKFELYAFDAELQRKKNLSDIIYTQRLFVLKKDG